MPDSPELPPVPADPVIGRRPYEQFVSLPGSAYAKPTPPLSSSVEQTPPFARVDRNSYAIPLSTGTTGAFTGYQVRYLNGGFPGLAFNNIDVILHNAFDFSNVWANVVAVGVGPRIESYSGAVGGFTSVIFADATAFAAWLGARPDPIWWFQVAKQRGGGGVIQARTGFLGSVNNYPFSAGVQPYWIRSDSISVAPAFDAVLQIVGYNGPDGRGPST